MKIFNTLTTVSLLSLTSFANAGEKCEKSCDKMAKKSGKCSTEQCEKDSCDKDQSGLASFVVAGMTCSACSDKLDKSLAALEGVSVKKVCHKSGHVMVKLDEAKVNKSKVTETITLNGFKVAGEKLRIPVSGMKCGACSTKLTKALSAVEGCSGVSVCHKSGHASLVIDLAKTSKAKVLEAIKATGLKAGKKAKVAPIAKTSLKSS